MVRFIDKYGSSCEAEYADALFQYIVDWLVDKLIDWLIDSFIHFSCEAENADVLLQVYPVDALCQAYVQEQYNRRS